MSDTLIVYLSEDAWSGDAQANLTINGVTAGGTLNVQATNALDNVETFEFSGNFGTAPSVSLSFINQGANNTGSQVRALYLDGFAYDGVAELNLKKSINYDQTDTYTLSAVPVMALRASDFINDVGVDAHLSYFDTSYGLGGTSWGPNTALVKASVAYLGIDHLRVDVPTAGTLPEMQSLAAAGDKFDVLMPDTSSPTILASDLAALAPLASAVSSIEGPNEVNLSTAFNWDGQTSLAAAAAYQRALYAAVRADPAIATSAVYNLTLGAVGASGYQGLSDLSAYATNGNVHVYYADGAPPASTLQYALSLNVASTPSLRPVITETNYSTAPTISGSVAADVQARYDLDLLMDATADGYGATYFYELLDERADPANANAEDHYGLFNADGSPKPAATALHNLTTILADRGASAANFNTGSLAYLVSGLPASGNTLLLEKSNGVFDLVIWAEPAIWKASTGTEVAATPRSVTVSFGGGSYAVQEFDPLNGTSALLTTSSETSANVVVTDHPVILEVSPVVPLPPTSLTLGSGNDLIVLAVSEDAYQGDAQYFVTVDGKQVGGLQTASALHGSGQSQQVSIAGNWGDGTHLVSINFTNDAYGGTAETDRNLYVTAVSYDGLASGESLTMLNTGTQTLTLGQPVLTTTIVGSGIDTFALSVSEDAYQGDALFTVSVDGEQIGGTLTAQASHAAGQKQIFDVEGTFGSGPHTISVNFLNDDYGGTPATDRNLYIDGATFDGSAVVNSRLSLMNAGAQSFQAGSPDTLTLGMSEDAYQGDAQCIISVDGQQVGGTRTVTALHASGQTQEITLTGSWGLGQHTISVDFLNDAYAGTPATDRNLYVSSASYNGASDAESLAQFTAGATPFTVTSATNYVLGAAGGVLTTIGNDTITAGAGSLSVAANGPSVSIIGSTGGLLFVGRDGNDTVLGGAGAVTLAGAGDRLSFTAGTGLSTIMAGSGHETFTLINGKSGGNVCITDFTAGLDTIHLQGYAGTGIISEETMQGSFQIIFTDQTRVTLTGVSGLSAAQIFS